MSARTKKKKAVDPDLAEAVELLFDLYVSYRQTDVLAVADKEALSELLGKPRIKRHLKNWLNKSTFYALKGTDVEAQKKKIIETFNSLGERVW